MKTWEEIVRDRMQRYLAILKGANDVHLGWSACDELRMVLESCVPVVRCRDCKHRGSDACPMFFEEWFTIDEGDGYVDDDYRIHDHTESDGYCSFGERKENSDGDD